MIEKLKKQFWQLKDSEKALVEKAVSGDGEAFGELYMKYIDPIYRYIFFRVNQDEKQAEDLVETVFYKAWQNITKFNGEGGNFRAWLYAITRNTIVDHVRQKESFEPIVEAIPDKKPGPEELFVKKTQSENLFLAINKLTDDQKQIIVLKFIEGLPNSEIAKIVNKNEDALRALQYRALKNLRKILEDYD